MQHQKVLITGGTGFIGSNVVKALSDAGHECTLVARNPDKVPALASLPGVQIMEGRMGDVANIAKFLPQQDACIHIALYWGEGASEMAAHETYSSAALFDACGKAGIQHLIYTSSTAAQGTFLPRMDETLRPQPVDWYGATKAASEAYLHAASHQFPDMRCNIIRPGYTYGNPVVPGGDIEVDSRFKDIVRQALANETIHLQRGDGTQFIHAPDLARLFLAVLQSEYNRETVYGLADPFLSWESIARDAILLTQSRSCVELEGDPPSQPYLFDLSKCHQLMGYAFDGAAGIRDHLSYLAEVIASEGSA